MKTNEQFVQAVLQKVHRVKKRNLIIKSILGAVSVCLLVFLLAFSNIITIKPHFSANNRMRFRFSLSLKMLKPLVAIIVASLPSSS